MLPSQYYVCLRLSAWEARLNGRIRFAQQEEARALCFEETELDLSGATIDACDELAENPGTTVADWEELLKTA